ncbi:MAG: hypothetical protein ACSHXF_01340 [Aquaticitalea sp.]
MKRITNILTLFTIALFSVSCSNDDNSEDTPAGGDHTYDVSITNGFLAGTDLTGTISNEDFSGMYFDYDGTRVLSLSLGVTASNTSFGGAIVLDNGQSSSLLNDEYDTESGGSTLSVSLTNNGQPLTFVSTSGSCSVSDLQPYGVQGVGIGGATYKLTFTGTFKQANFDGLEEDAPIIQMSGTLHIKKLITD